MAAIDILKQDRIKVVTASGKVLLDIDKENLIGTSVLKQTKK